MDRRIAAGMAAIIAGAVLLSVPAGAQLGSIWPALAVLGACLCWGLDNNLTRKVALADATWLAAVKGLVAGPVNLILAFSLGAQLPAAGRVAAALVVGFFAYGVSLVLFIVALRHVGTARASAYYSIAPFIGAALAVALGDPLSWPLVAAGVLMAVGVWLHLTENHQHRHRHERLTHSHRHTQDEHHQHGHPEPTQVGTWHTTSTPTSRPPTPTRTTPTATTVTPTDAARLAPDQIATVGPTRVDTHSWAASRLAASTPRRGRASPSPGCRGSGRRPGRCTA